MHAALRSGLELPALGLATTADGYDGAALAALRTAAAEAAAAGFGTLWFAERAEADGAVASSDPCVLAAACASQGSALHLGVVAGDGTGRHPAAAARDVTALDHLSGGRAALWLDYPGRALDAARVCRSLFTGTHSTVLGRVYRTEDAVNLPPPVQGGELPLVASAGDDELGGELAGSVDAVCVVGEAADVARVRATAGGAAVIWAGTPASDPGEAARQLGSVREAGADGVICRAGDLTQLTGGTIAAWAAAAVSAP